MVGWGSDSMDFTPEPSISDRTALINPTRHGPSEE